MGDHGWLAEQFEEHRRHLPGVAFRMLGSVHEADEAVQEAWLRLSRSDTSDVENPRGWRTTVTGGYGWISCAPGPHGREEPLDWHVPDPIVSPADSVDPEQEASLAESVGVALHVVLETRPAARVHLALVNGAAGVVVTVDRRPVSVMGFTVSDGRIVAIDALIDPERLNQLDLSAFVAG